MTAEYSRIQEEESMQLGMYLYCLSRHCRVSGLYWFLYCLPLWVCLYWGF